MIKSLTVTNPKGESLKLELTNPWESGLIVREITGLGPSRASIISQPLSSADGSIFSSARVENRQILITLQPIDGPDVETYRQKTYRYFPVKKEVTLLVETDNRTAEARGYVESNTPNIFSKEETIQISIVCTDPYFYETRNEEIAFSGVLPAFEFPFSNESLTEPLLEFGEIRLDTRAVLEYKGDADTGMYITIHVLGNTGNITIYNVDTYERITIDVAKIQKVTGKKVGAGDDIIISTMSGAKSVLLLRDGMYTNVISAVGKNPDWFQLSSGDNIFAYSAQDGGEKNLMVYFVYRNAYGGI